MLLRNTVCIAATAFALIGCGKSIGELRVSDLSGPDSTASWTIVSESGNAGKYRSVLLRLVKHDSLAHVQSWSLADLDRNESEWQAYAAPRMERYDAATNYLKSRLRVPSTARMGSFDGLDNDSVTVVITGDSAQVVGKYNAQNAFGTYLPGTYTAIFRKRDGKWTWRLGDAQPIDYIDFLMD